MGILVTGMACTQEVKIQDKPQTEQVQDKSASKGKEKYVTFHPNGKVDVNGILENGKREGTWSSWFDTGEKRSETTYENGQKNGDYRIWYKNGQVRVLGQFKDDVPQGVWISFDENGNKISEQDYGNIEE